MDYGRGTFGESKQGNGTDDADIDEMLFRIYRKEKIKQMRTELGGSVLNEIKKAFSESKGIKGVHDYEQQPDFARAFPKYFSEVISSLTLPQQKLINDHGFGSLLLYEDCIVPKPFVLWIANQVDVRTSEIFVKNKCIPFNKMSVHKILGLPIGGDALIPDHQAGKAFILSKFNLTEMPTVKFFGEKIKDNDNLADDELVICFVVVALCCFLCPNSNGLPSPKYMIALKDFSSVRNIDWSLFVYDCLIDDVGAFRTGSVKSDTPFDEPGGCSYLLAVLYLDCLNFGSFDVPRQTPRISVWKGSMIKFYSDLDEIKENQYGKRCFRGVIDTYYSEDTTSALDHNLYEHKTYTPSRAGFRPRLEASFGHMLNKQFVDGICDIFDAHCSKIPRKQQKLSENLIFAMLKLLDDLTPDGIIHSEDFVNVAGSHRPVGHAGSHPPIVVTSTVNVASDFVKSRSCGNNKGRATAEPFNCDKEKLPHDAPNKESPIHAKSVSKGNPNGDQRTNDVVAVCSKNGNSTHRQNDDQRTDNAAAGCSKNVYSLSTPILINKRQLDYTNGTPDFFVAPKKRIRPQKPIAVGSKVLRFDIDVSENVDGVTVSHLKKLCVEKSDPHVGVDGVDYVPNLVSSKEENKRHHSITKTQPSSKTNRKVKLLISLSLYGVAPRPPRRNDKRSQRFSSSSSA